MERGHSRRWLEGKSAQLRPADQARQPQDRHSTACPSDAGGTSPIGAAFTGIGAASRGRHIVDTVYIQPLIALIAGIVILIAPKILNYVIAIYLILAGLIGLFPNLWN
jgi:hypothetical protein